MKTPSFWYSRSPSAAWQRQFFAPLSSLYQFGARIVSSQNAISRDCGIPVLCVGNLVAGGSGKTPVALALSRLLTSSWISNRPYFVTRGYKSGIATATLVSDPLQSSKWGDEALLLARASPTIASPNRFEGAVLARNLGADAVILDDGLLSAGLRKTIRFCVIDSAMGFGNGATIPSGPLRVPLAEGFKFVDAFIVLGDQFGIPDDLRRQLSPHIPVFTAKRSAGPIMTSSTLTQDSYVGFCGLGYPRKFCQTLELNGYKISDFVSFPDHHPYTAREIADLTELARSKSARLITTEKDYVRIPENCDSSLIDVLPIAVTFEDEAGLVRFIRGYLPS